MLQYYDQTTPITIIYNGGKDGNRPMPLYPEDIRGLALTRAKSTNYFDGGNTYMSFDVFDILGGHDGENFAPLSSESEYLQKLSQDIFDAGEKFIHHFGSSSTIEEGHIPLPPESDTRLTVCALLLDCTAPTIRNMSQFEGVAEAVVALCNKCTFLSPHMLIVVVDNVAYLKLLHAALCHSSLLTYTGTGGFILDPSPLSAGTYGEQSDAETIRAIKKGANRNAETVLSKVGMFYKLDPTATTVLDLRYDGRRKTAKQIGRAAKGLPGYVVNYPEDVRWGKDLIATFGVLGTIPPPDNSCQKGSYVYEESVELLRGLQMDLMAGTVSAGDTLKYDFFTNTIDIMLSTLVNQILDIFGTMINSEIHSRGEKKVFDSAEGFYEEVVYVCLPLYGYSKGERNQRAEMLMNSLLDIEALVQASVYVRAEGKSLTQAELLLIYNESGFLATEKLNNCSLTREDMRDYLVKAHNARERDFGRSKTLDQHLDDLIRGLNHKTLKNEGVRQSGGYLGLKRMCTCLEIVRRVAHILLIVDVEKVSTEDLSYFQVSLLHSVNAFNNLLRLVLTSFDAEY
jgi:hypothetical protein